MKIDYDLHIKKEQAHHRPRPEIVDEITESSKKIFEIKASNGKGKTFLLNLIALSLRGHELDNDDILESIKKSISRYSQSSNYDLEFEIEYDLPNGNSLKSSQIKGALVTTYIAKGIEGPPIDKRTLHKDFTILYDIPTDPSERLNGVIKNTKAWNNNLIQKYNGFIRFLSDIIRDFGDSIDLNKINKYEQNIEHLKSEKEITLSDISSVKRLLSNLNHADLLKKLQRSNKKIEKLESERTKITSELKKNPKPNKEEQKDSKTIASLNNSYDLESRKFKESITQLIETIETKP
jgi:exonuclease SbcC